MIPFPSGTPGGYLFLLYSREEKVSQGCASTTSVGHLVGFSLVYSPAQRTSNFERPWSVARCTPEPWAVAPFAGFRSQSSGRAEAGDSGTLTRCRGGHNLTSPNGVGRGIE